MLTIKFFHNIYKFDTTVILRVYHSKQKTSNTFLHTHLPLKSETIDHLKNNCGQSQTVWNFSPDHKALFEPIVIRFQLKP